MRSAVLFAALLVFFSAEAAEKKTNPGAFKMPKRPARPEAAAQAPAPAPAPPAEAQPAPAPQAEKPAEATPVAPAAAPAPSKPELPPTAFTLPNHEKPHPPEAQSPAPPAPEAPPAPTTSPAPAPKRTAFSLQGQKAAAPKKRKPQTFKLPEKKE